MERKTNSAIAFLEGPITASKLSEIEDVDLVINGKLILDTNLYFKGNLYVAGEILGANNNIEIFGDFCCEGEVYLKEIIVSGDFIAEQLVFSEKIYVKGDMISEGNIINQREIRVLGLLFCKQKIISQNLTVGQNMYSLEYIDVKKASISVAGDFECEDAVETENLNVLGKLNIKGGIKASKIKVGI